MAFQYADNGYQRFPTSEELLELRQDTLKQLSRFECEGITKKLARAPRSDLVAKAIEIRRSLGEFSACEKLARRWKDKFPRSWILQFAIAKYLFHRTMTDKNPALTRRCLEQLQITTSLDPSKYKSALYLSTLLYQTGNITQALESVEELLSYHPQDATARSLWECIQNATESRKAAEHASDDAAVIDTLQRLERVKDVYAVLLQKGTGSGSNLVHSYFAGHGTMNFTESGVSALGDLIHSVRLSTGRMGIGEIKNCTFEGQSWKLFFRDHPCQSLLLCTSKKFSEEQFENVGNKVAPEGVMT